MGFRLHIFAVFLCFMWIGIESYVMCVYGFQYPESIKKKRWILNNFVGFLLQSKLVALINNFLWWFSFNAATVYFTFYFYFFCRNVQCYDTVEGAQCGPCPSGYDGDGRSCSRKDPCYAEPCAPGIAHKNPIVITP